jgi:hypothetical protein
MATTVQTLIDELLNEYSFDTDAAGALRALNRRHKKMVARARSWRKLITVGTTVAGQRDYPLSGILEVHEVQVGGVPYGKAPRQAQTSYARSELTWSPSDEGLADGTGTGELGLIPPPTVSGLAITAFGPVPADDLVQGGNILIDDDFADALVDGAAATFFARDAEQMATADRNETRFDAACEEYRRRVARAVRGPGPAQIRVQGLNA